MNPTRLFFLLMLLVPAWAPIFAQVSDPRVPILADQSDRKALPTWVDQWNQIFRPASVASSRAKAAESSG